MKLLAIETSSEACSVALYIEGEISLLHEIAPMQQAQKILAMIDYLLQQQKITCHDLTAIAVGQGPGSFTGVRLALSCAQALSFAAQLPVIPISSLAALAQTAYIERGWKKLLIAVDARMQEVYWAAYSVNPHHHLILEQPETIMAPSQIVLPSESDWSAIGNGWSVYASLIHDFPKHKETTLLPTAKAIAELAVIAFAENKGISPMDLVPVYLRNQVAKKTIER